MVCLVGDAGGREWEWDAGGGGVGGEPAGSERGRGGGCWRVRGGGFWSGGRCFGGGLVGHEWEESGAGAPRKYYRVTGAGDERLAALKGYWQELTETLSELGADRG